MASNCVAQKMGHWALGIDGIDMVNVWATENQLTLAQAKVANHTNEITTIPILLRLIEIDKGISAKRKRAGWDHNYLLKVLCQI